MDPYCALQPNHQASLSAEVTGCFRKRGHPRIESDNHVRSGVVPAAIPQASGVEGSAARVGSLFEQGGLRLHLWDGCRRGCEREGGERENVLGRDHVERAGDEESVVLLENESRCLARLLLRDETDKSLRSEGEGETPYTLPSVRPAHG